MGHRTSTTQAWIERSGQRSHLRQARLDYLEEPNRDAGPGTEEAGRPAGPGVDRVCSEGDRYAVGCVPVGFDST